MMDIASYVRTYFWVTIHIYTWNYVWDEEGHHDHNTAGSGQDNVEHSQHQVRYHQTTDLMHQAEYDYELDYYANGL